MKGEGVAHEGPVAASLGLKGIPGIAEAITAGRDILVAEMVGGRLHIAHMSAWTTLEAVRQGKSRGVQVTCEVAPHHFTLTDDQLAAPIPYDTDTKMNPPLREARDRDAMLQGIADGSVDVIATDHAPHHADEKNVEFDRAPFGIVGLETAIPIALDRLVHGGVIRLPRLVELMSVNPARILRVAGGSLAEGAAGRHHHPGARPAGHDRPGGAGQQVEEHALRRLALPRRRGGDHRRRARGLPQRGGQRGAGHRGPLMDSRRDDIRARAVQDLRRFEVVMEGHFDYGNGYHGRLYLNPHQLFRYPSTIWRVAQDLIDVLPGGIAEQVTVVAGPVTGGALLAHTIAGLLDGRRPLSREPYPFAPIHHTGPGGAEALVVVLRPGGQGREGAAGGRRAQHRTDLPALRRPDRRRRRHGGVHGADRRPRRSGGHAAGAERGAGRVSGAGEPPGGRLPAVRAGAAGDGVLSAARLAATSCGWR